MKNLKKFQEFALTQDEQKNVTGGRRLTCYLWLGDVAWPASYQDGISRAEEWCGARANCAGCF